jgi:hypothetical protein
MQVILQSVQNTAGVCKQFTLLIHDLVIFLFIIYSFIHGSNFLVLTIFASSIVLGSSTWIFVSQLFPPFFYISTSLFKLLRLSSWIQLRSGNHCSVTCFFCSKDVEYSCQTKSSCCFILWLQRLCGQNFDIPCELSNSANLFKILTWCFLLPYTSFFFFRLDIFILNFSIVCLLTENGCVILFTLCCIFMMYPRTIIWNLCKLVV